MRAGLRGGLDKGSADVAVGNDALAVGKVGGDSVASGGGAAGVGHGHDEVGIDGGFVCQRRAEGFADELDVLAEDRTGGIGEIDVLEDALSKSGRGVGEAARRHTLVGERDNLAGLDFADDGGSDDIEGDGFAGDDMMP